MAAHPEPDAQDTSATFAEMLRQLRLRAGLSQQALADLAGLSGAAISALEQGLRHSPYPHTLRALTCGLGLSSEESAALARAARRPRRPPRPRRTVVEYARSSDPARESLLSRPLTGLVGREAELRDVQHLLHASSVVTLVGPGGIGKTRLATHRHWS